MLERQVLKYLYTNYPLAIFMTLLLNGMLVSVVSNGVNTQSLLIWYLVLLVLQGFRLIDYLYFKIRQQCEIYSIFAIFRNFRLGTLASAITLGVLPLLIFKNVGLTEMVFVAFVFAGITAGATSNLGGGSGFFAVVPVSSFAAAGILFFQTGRFHGQHHGHHDSALYDLPDH